MKHINGIITILTIAISGYIGYSTNFVNTATATTIPVEKQVILPELPKTGFNLNIDMNTGKVVANASQDIHVDIQKKDSIVTRWKTKIVKKPIYIRVKELPRWAMPKEERTVVSSFVKTDEMYKLAL